MKSKITKQMKPRICNALNGCARKWTNKRVKLASIVFIVLSSGISAFVASRAVFGTPDISLYRRSQPPVRALPDAYPDYHIERAILLHKNIERMKRYLDSLSLHDTFRYQRVLKANPNLLKNIQSVESLFNQSHKK